MGKAGRSLEMVNKPLQEHSWGSMRASQQGGFGSLQGASCGEGGKLGVLKESGMADCEEPSSLGMWT